MCNKLPSSISVRATSSPFFQYSKRSLMSFNLLSKWFRDASLTIDASSVVITNAFLYFWCWLKERVGLDETLLTVTSVEVVMSPKKFVDFLDNMMMSILHHKVLDQIVTFQASFVEFCKMCLHGNNMDLRNRHSQSFMVIPVVVLDW